MHTLHCFNLWPMAPFVRALSNTFPTVVQNRLSATSLELRVPSDMLQSLTENLECLHVVWTEVE